MSLELLLLVSATVFVTGWVVVRQTILGRFFSLLSFYSLIFLLENVGGTLKAVYPDFFVYGSAIDAESILRTLAVALLGYLLFLLGYFIAVPSKGRKAQTALKSALEEKFFGELWNARYRLLLFIVILLTVLTGFIQHTQRIRAAGGLLEFLQTAYKYRMGTYAETEEQSVLLGFTSFLAGCAVGFAGIGILAWLKGKLSSVEKLLLTTLVVVLLIRQGSSMFRSTLFFTGIALLAVYDSHRPFSARRLAFFGLGSTAVLVAVNYFHQYLYFLTAEWDPQSFGQTLGNLVGPQGHFYALDTILSLNETSDTRLHGEGLLESIFFFVPRLVWAGKAPAEEYGTILIQSWAGLPSTYQIAVTNIGELIAHFGYPGALGLFVYGWIYGHLDSFAWKSIELRVGLYCLLLPRVLVDLGMGLSAFSNSLLGLAVFLVFARGLRLISLPVRRSAKTHSLNLPPNRPKEQLLT